MLPESSRCFLVRKTDKDTIETSLETRPLVELPAGDVLIRVEYSSLNYKDALAASGHPGVVGRFPHVPGIDAAGTVIASESSSVTVGEKVIVTSYDLGSKQWGAWSEYIRVPADWIVPLPESFTTREAMIFGTAGFTAAQCALALQDHGITPESGPVVVTGATGGVGVFAVQLLAKLGYSVVAVSGKSDQTDWLRSLGAEQVIERSALDDTTGKPLLKSQYSGAVDTVGGNTLATVLKSLNYSGCVAACGMVGGTDLPTSVYPFILRGTTLAGIDSAWCPRDRRKLIWTKLAGDWKLDHLEDLVSEVSLDTLPDRISLMLDGQHRGRTLVKL